MMPMLKCKAVQQVIHDRLNLWRHLSPAPMTHKGSRMKTLTVSLILIVHLPVIPCSAQLFEAANGDWPWWRGPGFNGIADPDQQVPVEWSETKNVAWKVKLPGRGHSSPVVVGNRLLLMTADDKAQTQSVLCFDRHTGESRWVREINRGGFQETINPRNTYATSTLACDSQRLFAVISHHDAVYVCALNLDGEWLWQRKAGHWVERQYPNGQASSPVLYGELVIIAADGEADQGGFIAALNRHSGEIVWKTSRPPASNYASPVVARVAGRDQVLISGCDQVASYSPMNGKLLWSVPAKWMQTGATPVWEGDVVVASGGYPAAETLCVRADGSGRVVWRNNQKCYEQSLLITGGHVYAINDNGIALCWAVRTGEELWRKRLGGPISASPILVGNMIYASNERGTTFVCRVSPDGCELLAENQLGTEAFATPAICGGRIFLRVAVSTEGQRQEQLYCIQDR